MPNKVKLKEMTDAAALSAGRALSKFTGEQVNVRASKARVTKVTRIFSGIEPESLVAGIYLPVTGEIKGASLLILPEKTAYALSDALVKRGTGAVHQFTELEKSALKEVGNIVCGSFLTVFSNTLKIKIIEHIPQFSFDMFRAVVDQIIAEFASRAEEALVIEIALVFEKTSLKGYVALLFGLEEMKAITDVLV
ncbi:MAG: chemotaxis protein CheC [bacterium]